MGNWTGDKARRRTPRREAFSHEFYPSRSDPCLETKKGHAIRQCILNHGHIGGHLFPVYTGKVADSLWKQADEKMRKEYERGHRVHWDQEGHVR